MSLAAVKHAAHAHQGKVNDVVLAIWTGGLRHRRTVGNMRSVLCASSYAGQLFLVVTADARGFPDLDVLMAGMTADGRALLGSHGDSESARARANIPTARR